MTYDRKSLKQRARQAISQTRPKAWVVTLVLVALVTLLPTLVQQLIPGKMGVADVLEVLRKVLDRPERAERVIVDALGRAAMYVSLSALVSILFALFRAVMEYGYCGYALRVYRGEKAGVGALFRGFSRLGTVLGSAVMVGIFIWLWMMLMILVSTLLGVVIGLLGENLPGPVRVLVLAVITVLDVVWGLWITYRYVLTPYFVMSRPDLGVFDAINASEKAMKGNKVRCIVLELSFLGWRLLLGLIAFVVSALGAMLGVLLVGSSLDRMLSMAESPGDVDLGAVVRLMAELIEDVGLAFAVVGVVAMLVCLPLKLWLKSYESVALAGFFQEIVGNSASGAAVAMTAAAPVPVAQSVPGASFAPQSGEQPYDPFGGTQPPAPQPPRQGE